MPGLWVLRRIWEDEMMVSLLGGTLSGADKCHDLWLELSWCGVLSEDPSRNGVLNHLLHLVSLILPPWWRRK